MKRTGILLFFVSLAFSSCKKSAERFVGNEVFGVPALVSSGTTNEKLQSVLPPGLQELDLGMSRKEVAKSRAKFFQGTGPVVHGLNESTIELHDFDSQNLTSNLPIDRVELSFSDDTDSLDEIWTRSEYGTASPEHFIALAEGLVEVFGEPTKVCKVQKDRDFVLLWVNEKTNSGIKVHFSDSKEFRPLIDFYVQTKHKLLEEDSGLNKWIAKAPSEKGMSAVEFTRKFVEQAFQ